MDHLRSAPPHPASQSPVVSSGQPGPAVPPAGAGLSQATLLNNLSDFALDELVRGHRSSFAPHWSIESWAKLLIWLALNSGCAGDTASLEAFAAALGPALSGRLRRRFFERELEEQELRLLADPAEARVLALPLAPGAPSPDPARVAAALAAVGLADRVAPLEQWQPLEGLLAIPWQRPA